MVGENQNSLSILCIALFPTTFWMHMSYSESTFLFFLLLAMYGMVCEWRAWFIALVVGLTTAVRPVGIALVPAFVLYLWKTRASERDFFKHSLQLLPLCVWGIGAYVAYQWYEFDEPFAFVKTQIHWFERMPSVSLWQRFMDHLTLEPFWRVYDADHPCYWGNDQPQLFPLFSMQFMNPLIVLSTWGLVGWGCYRKVIDSRETLVSFVLLAIPYLTHAQRACCSSEARYASVVFPFYIVLGCLLNQLPSVLSSVLLTIMAVFLAIYTSLFVQWYWFY